ncbi:putative peptidylarginine deiminase [Beauveria bassiana ARSEF 2860]|uniref:Putative peptidylarginine deiminase n=1 Tax=Beauveria bassiana (strain ARSEF 2860) TaxID=655819 RepID=J5J2S1_BEAB2|nr:putative peptidylarginine deiminase [Beauveria bassiana ARSEF 2860]EJP61118.1 putative peptidylarginine deiminase [Beauveria bassiana ARSEF 2860]
MHPALFGYLTGTIAVSTVAASIITPQKAINPVKLDIPVTILADTNRDGHVDELDIYGKHAWTTHRGAIFLPNIGDELHRCHVYDAVGTPLSNRELAACNDAAGDMLINSTLAAPVKTLPLAGLSENATARIFVQPLSASEHVRLFWKHQNGDSPSHWAAVKPELLFNSTALSAGLTLAVDARHLVSDKVIWDGQVDIEFEVTDGMRSGSDFVAMRQAPVLLHHHRQSMDAVVTLQTEESKWQGAFVNSLRDVIHELAPAVPLVLLNNSRDIWAQDFMEPAFASMPGRHGPISIRVLLRSAQSSRPDGRLVFEKLRGAGVGGWQPGSGSGFGWEEINSGGNIETIPPYTSRSGVSYRNGRIVLGKHFDKHPATSLTKFLKAQREQTPLYLEAGWLVAGHIDELVQFLPHNNTIGFRVAVPDTRSAMRILKRISETGHGAVPFLTYKGDITNDPWAIFADHNLPNKTVETLLLEEDFAKTNEYAQKFIDRNVELLLEELPISDADVLRVPALWRDMTYDWVASPDGFPARFHHTMPGERQLQSFFPLAVNGLVLDHHYIAPKPFGPRADGVDVFEREIRKVYMDAGFNVVFIDDYMSHHVRGGEVHCGTNSLRRTDIEWWKTS